MIVRELRQFVLTANSYCFRWDIKTADAQYCFPAPALHGGEVLYPLDEAGTIEAPNLALLDARDKAKTAFASLLNDREITEDQLLPLPLPRAVDWAVQLDL